MWSGKSWPTGGLKRDLIHPLLFANPLQRLSLRTLCSISFLQSIPSLITRCHSLQTNSAEHKELLSKYERMFSATWSRPFLGSKEIKSLWSIGFKNELIWECWKWVILVKSLWTKSDCSDSVQESKRPTIDSCSMITVDGLWWWSWLWVCWWDDWLLMDCWWSVLSLREFSVIEVSARQLDWSLFLETNLTSTIWS